MHRAAVSEYPQHVDPLRQQAGHLERLLDHPVCVVEVFVLNSQQLRQRLRGQVNGSRPAHALAADVFLELLGIFGQEDIGDEDPVRFSPSNDDSRARVLRGELILQQISKVSLIY